MERINYLNRYRVVPDAAGASVVIRRSGAAVTCKAVEIRSGAEIALEVIPAFGLSEATRADLQEEADAAKKISHINIPALYDFGIEGDQILYAWENFDGTTAEEWIQSHGSMPIGPVLRIALQVVSALTSAAFHGIVHPAINPRNIILVQGQTPQGDWPLIKLLNLVGVAPSFTGSNADADAAAFAAKFAGPEQLEGGVVDFRSEMYSLGATLWYLLSGSAPVPGAVLRRVNGVPKSVMELLTLMLSLNPEDRPQDPVILQDQISDCLNQVERRETIERNFAAVIPAAVPVIESASPRRGPWVALAIAALLIACATVGAFFLPDGMRPNQLLASFTQPKPIGVPVGVPETATQPNPAAPSAETAAVSAPVPVASNSAAPGTPEPEAIAANDTSSANVPSAEVTTQTPQIPTASESPSNAVTSASPTETETPAALVAKNEGKSAVQAEPAPPAEGPSETDTPPTYSAHEPDPSASTPTYSTRDNDVAARASDPEPAPPAAAPAPAKASEPPPTKIQPREHPVAAASVAPVKKALPAKERPRRIDGREVRPAEPVAESDITPPAKETPIGRKRAKFVGIAPDGSLIFEVPETKKRGFLFFGH